MHEVIRFCAAGFVLWVMYQYCRKPSDLSLLKVITVRLRDPDVIWATYNVTVVKSPSNPRVPETRRQLRLIKACSPRGFVDRKVRVIIGPDESLTIQDLPRLGLRKFNDYLWNIALWVLGLLVLEVLDDLILPMI